jgi:oligoribonuclease NrnB/cAMP/cGMP phosphodiesterase (DHH superfamily)
MKKLNKKEQIEIVNLSKRFIDIHSQIVKVEKEIHVLENQSSILISDLEICRETEKEFCRKMSEKYGEGELDPLSMMWKIKSEVQR